MLFFRRKLYLISQRKARYKTYIAFRVLQGERLRIIFLNTVKSNQEDDSIVSYRRSLVISQESASR